MSDPSPLEAIFFTALEKASLVERTAYLDVACAGDSDLRERIERMLAAQAEAGSFLEVPAGGIDRTIDQSITEGPGTQIGPYKLLQRIGEGGFGVVYLADQTEPVQRRVALKIIKPGMDTRQVIARFEAESQALAMMDHPNIAKVLDAGTTDSGRPYFVMELVKGVPITQFCDERQLTPRERLELFVPVCQALQHAHQKGIIHRDIKPSNVLVAKYDDRPVPKVIDFGVVKAIEQHLTEKTMFTQFGQIVGTVEYMSPEQADLNQLDIDTRSDVYSLGVLLYELLTGETPFDRQRLRSAAFDELLRIIREEEPPKPSLRLSTSESLPSIAANRHIDPKKLSSLVHGELDWIVMKALEKDRTRRYETANGFANDIQRYLNDEAVVACPPSAGYRFRKFARRNKPLIATSVAIAAALVIGTGLAIWQAIRAIQERDRAVIAEATATEEAERADTEAMKANQQAARANVEANRAEQQRRLARREQYHAEMVAGQTDVGSQNLGGLYTRLVNYLPLDGEQDHRDWEWYYLMSHCRQEERTLVHPGRSPYAAWSPDGQYIGAPGAIWRADTGDKIRRFDTSNIARVRSAWSPDGKKFAWCMTADECAFYVWDRPSDSVSRFAGHTFSVLAVAWSPDGSQIASSSHDRTIKIWDVATKTTLWTSPVPDHGGHGHRHTLAWSPDGELLAAGNGGYGVQVWDAMRRELVKEYFHLLEKIGAWHSVAWHPDGSVLAASDNESWYLLDRNDWSVKHRQKILRGRAIAYSPDGSQIAVTEGEAVTVWDAIGKTKLAELNGHLRPVVSVLWNPDNRRLVTADSSGLIKLWDLDQLVEVPHIDIGVEIQMVAWLDDNQTLVTIAQGDGSSAWWDTRDGSLRRREQSAVKVPFQLSPDRGMAAVHQENEHVLLILDAASGTTHATLELAPERTVQSHAFSSDGSRIVIQSFADKKTFLDVWEIGQEEQVDIWRSDRHGQATDYRLLTWERAGTRVATAGWGDSGDDGSQYGQDHLHVFEAAEGRRILKWNPVGSGKISCLAWSRDGHFLALGTSEGRVEVVDVENQSERFSKKLYRHGISALAWHPAGNRLAYGTMDGTVKLASSIDGGVLLSFSLSEGQATKLAWSDDGQRLAAATTGGHIHTWGTGRTNEISADGPRRNEFAWAYFDRAEYSSGETANAALREFLRYAPDTLNYWEARGSALARLGKFEEAAQEYSKGVEPNVQHAFGAACSHAYALLGARKMDDYREACARLVDEFKDSPVPSNRRFVAWLCTLAPHQKTDWKQVLEMARSHDNSFDDPFDAAQNDDQLLYRAAGLYRDRQYDGAVRILTKLVAKLDRGSDRTGRYHLACSQYFLAMALHKTDDRPRAVMVLSEANGHAIYVKDMNAAWRHAVVHDTLRHEAQALIQQEEGKAVAPDADLSTE